MRLAIACWSVLLVIATAAASPARSVTPLANPAFRGVAVFEAPKSVGTPLAEIAQQYAGVGLAARITGRLPARHRLVAQPRDSGVDPSAPRSAKLIESGKSAVR